jgi:hypothetical protein
MNAKHTTADGLANAREREAPSLPGEGVALPQSVPPATLSLNPGSPPAPPWEAFEAEAKARAAAPPADTSASPVLAKEYPPGGLGGLVAAMVSQGGEEYLARQEGRALGPVTGLPELDLLLGGRLQPGVHVLTGPPGLGKTAMAVQIAADCGQLVIYLTAEMGAMPIFYRLVSFTQKTFLSHLGKGELPPEALAALYAKTASSVPHLGIIDASVFPEPLAELKATVARWRGAAPYALVVVDSIHRWARGSVPTTRRGDMADLDRLNTALEGLRAWASDEGIAVLGLSERNRGSMADGGLHSSKGSSDFEYTGETVLGLDPQMSDDGKIEVPEDPLTGIRPVVLRISKNRGTGDRAALNLNFHRWVQRFEVAPT